jgi:hypothetical protein
MKSIFIDMLYSVNNLHLQVTDLRHLIINFNIRVFGARFSRNNFPIFFKLKLQNT